MEPLNPARPLLPQWQKRLGKTASIIFVGLGFTAEGAFFTMWDTVRPWVGKLFMK